MAGNIRVVCRFRPQNRREVAEGGVGIVRFDVDTPASFVMEGKESVPTTFTFDEVFAPEVTQEQVFDSSVRSIVQEVLKGYNGTVFAYGQTGSGKTYTMMGSDIDSAESKGVIPRISEQIFCCIAGAPACLEFTVKVAYMEIYMEKIRDLLNPLSDNLQIHEDRMIGVYVKDLTGVYVTSIGEVLEVMRHGQRNRVVASTQMNAESSRSHSIFMLTVIQKSVVDGTNRSGRLYLVDLAGSEKVGKTGATGQTLEEAKKINKSLTALGMVINALTDGRSTHVPYRDSKLTRILQESLGGNSQTTLIINASPSSFNEAETFSTLRFGVRAKSIKNKAKINEELSAGELKVLLRKSETQARTFERYIGLLEGELCKWRAGSPVKPTHFVTYEKFAATTSGVELGASTVCRVPQNPGSGSAVVPLLGYTAAGIATEPQRGSGEETDDDGRIGALGNDGTPVGLDEREGFLRREIDLVEEIEQREMVIRRLQGELDAANQEIRNLKDIWTEAQGEKTAANIALQEVRQQVEHMVHDQEEKQISVDAVAEKNTELERELGVQHTAVSALEHKVDALELELAHAKRIFLNTTTGTVIAADQNNKNNETMPEASSCDRVSMDGELQAAHEQLQKHLETTIGGTDGFSGLMSAVLASTSEGEALRAAFIVNFQERCERVVELEIVLEDFRSRYERLVQNTNTVAMQNKVSILERNMEQMGEVTRQLAQQNTALKRSQQQTDQLLEKRAERINFLEKETQAAVALASEQRTSYEAKVRELETNLKRTGGDGSKTAESWAWAARIVRPLRGGGGGGTTSVWDRGVPHISPPMN